MTAVLKKWEFKECVISDYNNNIPVLCPDEAIRAENDLMMEASGGASMFADKTSTTALKSLHRGAKNILYCYVGAQYSFATAKGLNVDTPIPSASKGKDVFV